MRKMRKRELREKDMEFTIPDKESQHIGQHDYADIYSHDFFLGRDAGSIQEHKPWEN